MNNCTGGLILVSLNQIINGKLSVRLTDEEVAPLPTDQISKDYVERKLNKRPFRLTLIYCKIYFGAVAGIKSISLISKPSKWVKIADEQ